MPVLGSRALAFDRARDPGVRDGHRARWPWPHLGRVCDGRRCDPSLCACDPHGADPRQRSDRRRSARRHLQLDDADLLARLRHLGRVEHDRKRQLPKPAQHQDRFPPADTAPVVPGSVGHVLQSRGARQPATARRLPTDDRHRRSDGGPRRGRGRPPLPHRRRRPRLLRGRAGADRGADPRGSGAARAVRCRRDHRDRRRLGDGRREGDAPVPREPAAEYPRALAAVPRRAQANRRLPADRAQGAAGGDPDDVRHGLGGLAGRGDQRRDSGR